jgi:hypothetical protein
LTVKRPDVQAGDLLRRWGLLAALLLGVTLRLGAVALTEPHDVNAYEFGIIGRNLAEGRGYSYFSEQDDGSVVVDGRHDGRPLPSAFMPPAYTYTVAGAIEVTDDRSDAIRLLQLLQVALGGLSIYLMYRLASEVGGPVAGAVAAIGYAGYPPLVFQVTQVSASNLYLPVELALLFVLVRASRAPTTRRVVAAGLLLGGLCLLRSEAVALIGLAAAWIWWVARVRGTPHRVRLAGLLAAVALVLPGAWAVRNSVIFDRPVVSLSTTAGLNLLTGNHDGASGSQKRVEWPPALDIRLERLPATDDYELQHDQVHLDLVIEHIRSNPLDTVALDVKKLAMMLTLDPYDHRTTNVPYVGAWFVLLALGLVGLRQMSRVRGDRPAFVLLVGYGLFGLLIPTAFFALARYKLSIEVPFLVFAGLAIANRLGATTGDPPAGPDPDDRDQPSPSVPFAPERGMVITAPGGSMRSS